MFDSNCRRCPLHNNVKSVCIPADGPDDADILFYGEAPGEAEDDQNTPFVGSAGQEHNVLLVKAGLGRKKVRTSNTVRCRPPDNRDPKDNERAACMFYTVREIAEVKPKIIVALGVSALKALTGAGKIGDNRGKMLSLSPEYRSDVPVLATYHPAAYLHQPGMRESYSKAIIEDMQLAQRIASGSVMKAKVITSLNKGATIRGTLERLAKCKVLGCDLEWEVLPSKKKDPLGMWPWSMREGKKPRPVCISIAGKVDGKMLALSVPFTSEYADRIREIISVARTIFHNGLADLVWLHFLGWKTRLGGDSYLLAALLNIDSSLSLEALASTLTNMSGWKKDTGAGTMPTSRDAWRKLLRRNAKDAIATRLLHPALMEMVRDQRREDVLPLYKHVLLPAVSILARTALNGTPIDERLLKKMRTENQRQIRKLTEEIGDTLGLSSSYETIIDSGPKLAPYLERLGIELPRTKKTNRPSVTDDILLQNNKAHKIVPVIRRRRKKVKRESSYWRPWTRLLELQRDKRLHTSFKLTVARTGRSSAESEMGYTFQQFLRGTENRRLVHAKKGWLIAAVDESQIELRLIAWKAKERRMLDFLNNNKDLHSAMAGFMKALGKGRTLNQYLKRMDDYWIPGVTGKERTGAKPVNFGLGFGGGPGVVKRTARQDYGIFLTDEQAQTGYDAYHLFYPDVKPWQDTFWRDVQRGYGVTSLGRRRTVSEDAEGPEGIWRKYINLDIQGTASDLSLFCMDYMWELLEAEYKRHLHKVVENIGFFHDAALLHFLATERKTIKAIMRQSWEHPPLERLGLELPVPLVADITIKRYWT